MIPLIRWRTAIDAVQIYLVLGLGVTGTMLMGLGTFLIARGLLARGEITAALIEENATTPSGRRRGSPGSNGPPPELIHDGRTARIRSEEIKQNTLTKAGPYQKIPEDHPDRQWFLNGLTIRNALNMAIMGYGITNLAIGTGVGFVLMGAAAVALGIPAVLRLGGGL